MANGKDVSDDELRKKLTAMGQQVGPITDSTRSLYMRKYISLLQPAKAKKPIKKTPQREPDYAAFFSSGDDSDAHEPLPGTTRIGKAKTSSASTESPSRNRRLSTAANTVASYNMQTQPPVRNVPDKSTLTDMGPPISPAKAARRGRRKPKLLPPQRDDYETGSDLDDNIGPANKEPPPQSLLCRPLEALGLGPSSSSSAATSSTSTLGGPGAGPFYSKFGQSLGARWPMDSNNGNNMSSLSQELAKDLRAKLMLPQQKSTTQQPLSQPQSDEHPWFNTSTVSRGLIAVVVIFFAYLTYCYIGMQPSPEVSVPSVTFENYPDNNFPLCKDGQLPGVNCVSPQDARHAMSALKALVPMLNERATKALCDDGDRKTAYLTFKQVEQYLKMNGDSDCEFTVPNMRLLARSNPHWGVSVLDNGFAVTNPSVPLTCYIKSSFVTFVFYLLTLAFVLGAICAIGWAYYTHMQKEELIIKQRQALMSRTLDILHSRVESSNDHGNSGITMPELRSLLLGPNPDNSLKDLLHSAVKQLTMEDQRVRIQICRLNGEESSVVLWIPHPIKEALEIPGIRRLHSISSYISDPNTLIDPDITPVGSPAVAPVQEESASTASSISDNQEQAPRRQRVWQGQAFETMEGLNALPASPTPCLKIRNMFDPESAGWAEDTWKERICNAILEKCGDSANILHLAVGDAFVYARCASQMDAGRAYRLLHGAWYDGNLITVKYIHLRRYFERYPVAAEMCIPIRPSNNDKLSLQGYWTQSQKLERN